MLPFLLLAATLATGFEPPPYNPGDVNGQNGWGHLSNSPTGGVIEPVPAGSPPAFGVQSLAIRTRNVDFFGVASHLYSPTISPAAGETGSTAGGVVVPDPESHVSASFWFRTPDSPLISTRGDGRFAELNPSSKGSAPDDAANRYAQVRLANTTNTADGRVRVEMGWYRSSGFTLATVALLDWGQWYRFEYVLELVDGLDGTEPNDRFTLTIFDANGTQLGSACGSTWELGWKSGTFGGGATPRAVNGFDFWSLSGPNGNLAGHLDEWTMSTFSAAPLAVTIDGSATVPMNGVTTLRADAIGGSGTIRAYEWRDAQSNVVGTSATFDAPVGTYSVMVTDSLCRSATSAEFSVANAEMEAVPTVSEIGLGVIAVALIALALLRLQ